MNAKITTSTLMKMKQDGKRITALTAYDYPFGLMADEAGVDIVLVGDSLGMVVQGQSSTLPVSIEIGLP